MAKEAEQRDRPAEAKGEEGDKSFSAAGLRYLKKSGRRPAEPQASLSA